MIGLAIPLFRSGNLLRKEMLSALKDYAFGFSKQLFCGYADGILTGCSVTTTESTITLNPGIVVYEGRVYVIQEPCTQPYYHTETTSIFLIRMKEKLETENFEYREIEVCTEKKQEVSSEGIEVCRFKLQKGFKLRTDYVNFDDRITEFDTVNVIHSPYSAFGESSISPGVVTDFARVLRKGSKNPLDVNFCMNALASNGFALPKEVIITYLEARLDKTLASYDNHELFKSMSYILLTSVAHSQENEEKREVKRRILLD